MIQPIEVIFDIIKACTDLETLVLFQECHKSLSYKI